MRHRIQKLLFGILFLAVISSILFAQLPDEKTKKIDSLFTAWDAPNHPGGSVGIMLNGDLVYSRAFGLASLEYLVPNTFDTQYNIASVSKQFTAFGICLLHLKGRLSIDDDIRKYLPELPEFKYKVTIRHMLHHTSGLRSLHTLLALAGWRGDDSRTNEDLMRFMKRQKNLNFVPGSEYMYCNTGYILMAEIIEKITGEDFAGWMDKNVFKPLGMHHTYVERHYNHVVKNNATSYVRTKANEFDRSIEYWGYVGSGNIHTDISDLLIWLEQLRDPAPQWQAAFALLKTQDNFNNGKPNDYAFGIRMDTYKDEIRIGHGGSIGGFRSRVCTYPEKKLSIVLLTNFSTSNPAQKADAITDIILDKPPMKPARKPFRLKSKTFDRYAGRYALHGPSSKVVDIFRIGNVFFAGEKGGKNVRIIPVSENKFIIDKTKIEIVFKAEKDAIPAMEYTDQKKWTGKRIKEFKADQKTLEDICGTYWSPELETQYVLYLKDGKLMGHHPRHGDFSIRYIREGEFNGEPSFFRFFKAQRNNQGKIIGIYVTNSRVRDLWFRKGG